jgi:hypothetical protein
MIRWRDEQSGQATSWYAKLGGWLELEPTPHGKEKKRMTAGEETPTLGRRWTAL